MKKINKYLITITIILSTLVGNINAKTYYCPSLPFTAKVGDLISDNWEITYNEYNEKLRPNIVGKLYQWYIGKKYDFSKWFALTSAGNPDVKLYYIGCCSVFDKENLSLCAKKKLNHPVAK